MSDFDESVAHKNQLKVSVEVYEEVRRRLRFSSFERFERAEVDRRVFDWNRLRDMYLLLHRSHILKIRVQELQQ